MSAPEFLGRVELDVAFDAWLSQLAGDDQGDLWSKQLQVSIALAGAKLLEPLALGSQEARRAINAAEIWLVCPCDAHSLAAFQSAVDLGDLIESAIAAEKDIPQPAVEAIDARKDASDYLALEASELVDALQAAEDAAALAGREAADPVRGLVFAGEIFGESEVQAAARKILVGWIKQVA